MTQIGTICISEQIILSEYEMVRDPPFVIESNIRIMKYMMARIINNVTLKPCGVKANRIYKMTNTQNFAKRELDILAATVPDSIVTPFAKEILALCEAFDNSGQSGGSAPYTATAISKAVKHLMLQEPICDVTGHESEWSEPLDNSKDITCRQNLRCSGLFLETTHFVSGDVSRAYYLDAIVWKCVEDGTAFTGSVYYDDINFELIGSKQFVRFPFKPKTFYIDVVRVPIKKEEAESRNLYYIEDGFNKCYYSIVKDPTQLDRVFKYYDKK
jgi:hypothetical protein